MLIDTKKGPSLFVLTVYSRNIPTDRTYTMSDSFQGSPSSNVFIPMKTAAVVACLFMMGCAGSFFGKQPRDFIEVEDIAHVPESDPFRMRDVRIENDSLKFTASYGGGCRKHVFTLYASRGKGQDNTAHLYVQHNGNHDLCRALIDADSVSFSLKGLKSTLGLRGSARLVSAPQMETTQNGFTLTY